MWLDRAPKGCDETGPWFRRHDEYARILAAVREAKGERAAQLFGTEANYLKKRMSRD